MLGAEVDLFSDIGGAAANRRGNTLANWGVALSIAGVDVNLGVDSGSGVLRRLREVWVGPISTSAAGGETGNSFFGKPLA